MRNLAENLTDIASDSANFPRRYFANGKGHRVIVGLSLDETFEFETLEHRHADAPHPVAADDRMIGRRRWLELYAKHAKSWDAWMQASKTHRTIGRLPAL